VTWGRGLFDATTGIGNTGRNFLLQKGKSGGFFARKFVGGESALVCQIGDLGGGARSFWSGG